MRTAFQGGRGTSWALHIGAVLASAACACAQAAAIDAGGSLVATTDYIYRGLTQSGRKATLQADAHLQGSSGWFLGAWGSLASSPPDIQSRSEINLYLGRSWVLWPDWTTSVHYARYVYPDGRRWARYYYHDYDELQMALGFQDRVSLSVAYSPEVRRYSAYAPGLRRGRQLSYEASLRQPLWRNLALTAGLGHYDLTDLFGESYWAWSGGAELGLQRLTFMLTRFGTDRTARQLFGRQTADDHWALTAAWRF